MLWNSIGAFRLRENEELISAYITDECGYIAAVPNHFYSIESHGFSIPNDKKLLGVPLSYPDKGYVTSFGNLVVGAIAVDVCKLRGFSGDFTDSRVIQELIGKDWDLPLAQKLCNEHNRRREVFYQENDNTISTNKLNSTQTIKVIKEKAATMVADLHKEDSENIYFGNKSMGGKRPGYKPEPGSGQSLPPVR